MELPTDLSQGNIQTAHYYKVKDNSHDISLFVNNLGLTKNIAGT